MSESDTTKACVAFDYLYRDASNYKAFGTVWLCSSLSETEWAELVSCCKNGQFFIAEQVGVPALYNTLFEDGGGPTEDDHAWHMIDGIREQLSLPEDTNLWGEASTLLCAFRAAKGNWNPELSPNFI